MKKIELLEHCNFYGLAVVEGSVTDTFVYEVRGVTVYKGELQKRNLTVEIIQRFYGRG